jgi:hypothetical protein
MRIGSLILAGWLGLTAPAVAAETNAPAPTDIILVQADGSVDGAAPVANPRPDGRGPGRRARYDFGLPRQSPTRRWLEEDNLPICHTRWEKDGIRYTQSVLLTRLQEGDPTPAGKAAPDAVLMVRLMGECLASEYTEATAAFGVEWAGQPLNLELRDGLACRLGGATPTVVASVEISGTGIATTNGTQLRFRGHMPPGTSGWMTIKIPVCRLEGDQALNQLRDLEFDEESRRLKRAWRARLETGSPQSLPVVLAEPAQ